VRKEEKTFGHYKAPGGEAESVLGHDAAPASEGGKGGFRLKKL